MVMVMVMVMGTDCLSPEAVLASPLPPPRVPILLLAFLGSEETTIACQCKVKPLLRNSILTANCTPPALPRLHSTRLQSSTTLLFLHKRRFLWNPSQAPSA